MKNNPPKINFSDKQREFAAYIRDPKNNPIPDGIPEQRMAAYRELFFNNVDSFLANNFPVIRQLLNDEQWFELAQDFYSTHVCQTPYFAEFPEEFLNFLAEERQNPNDYPFLLELAHYEWIEMALSISKEQHIPHTADLTEQATLQLSPLAVPLIYQYPVYQISPSFLPTEPPAQVTCLIVYRDLHDDIHFMEITPLTYQLLAPLQEQENLSVKDCLENVITQNPQLNPDSIKQAGLNTLRDLAQKQVVILS